MFNSTMLDLYFERAITAPLGGFEKLIVFTSQISASASEVGFEAR
jgi:hypothetical protein